MDNINRLITKQVLSWSKREALARKKQVFPGEWPIITISRQFGARGRTVSKKLSKRMGFKAWDKDLLSAIAEEAGADERFMASLDEKRRKMIDDTLYGFLMGSKLSNTHYFRSLVRVVQTIAAHGKSIIVGRGSNYIIKSKDILRVLLVCPIDQRASFIAKNKGITLKKAIKLIQEKDGERNDFIFHYFKKESGNVNDFDIILNSGVFKTDQLTDLILSAYEKKIGKTIPSIG
jgi:cytidylate kinase